jgi:hypothetical protein
MALEIDEPTSFELKGYTFLTSVDLKINYDSGGAITSIVNMASDDATSAGWVRTKEQICGGELNRPRKLRTEEDVHLSLIEHDLAFARPSSSRVLHQAIRIETARFEELPWKFRVAFSVNKAQRYGLTHVLAAFSEFAHVQEPANNQTHATRL